MNHYVLIGGILLAGILVLLGLGARKISVQTAVRKIHKAFDKKIGKRSIAGAVALIDSPEHGVHQRLHAGNIEDENRPFHVASIGKAFTAALIGTLIDEGTLRLEDRIAEHLDPGLLAGLFVVGGEDHSGAVTVGHLLSHMSGIADYFEDAPVGARPMRELILEDQNKLWSPVELVAFTREHQSAAGRPGERFHYSDTGYILLGLLIEAVSKAPFHSLLHKRIFEPLHMDDSYLLFYSKPKNPPRPMADVWLRGVNIKAYPSLSIDWAGGGIVSTVSDLAAFVRALNAGEIVKSETLQSLYRFDHKYMIGIRYGYGFMQYRFNEFSFLLKSLPRMIGHMGVLGTQMVYDPATGGVYIASFGSDAAPAASVRTMIKVLRILQKTRP